MTILIIVEHIQDTFTPVEINTRVKKVFSQATSHNQETDGHWRVSFEEGINQTDINDGQLPKSGEGNHGFLDLKLVHTQWRYDFGFTTPTCMFVLIYDNYNILIYSIN